MVTEAQKRANVKWMRDNRKQLNISFYSSEQSLFDWCKEKGASEIKKILKEVKEREVD